MPALAVVDLVLLAAAVTWLLAWIVRHHRTPVELRGDWWTSFEREFRAYGGGTPRSERNSRRRDPPAPTA
jgi:hypothetical protein